MTSVEPDELHDDIDPDTVLDLTGDELVDEWRGVNAEDVEEVTGGLAGLLRSRSRHLLADLLRPHHRPLAASSVLIAISVGARLAMPWLVQRGIDEGIPPLLDGGSGTIRPLVMVVFAVLVTAAASAAAFNAFLLLIGRVGQDVVLDVRERLFRHFQRLSTSFHERYTSGRVISRQTSDVEAIADLLGHGLINLITSALLVGGIGVALVLMDPRSALVSLGSFPILYLMTPRLPEPRRAGVPRHPRGGGAGHRPFRGEPGGHPCRPRLSAGAPQPGDLRPPRRPVSKSQQLVRPAGRGLRPQRAAGGSPHDRPGAGGGGQPGARWRSHGGRAGGLPPLPTSVLRAHGGAQPVLQPVPGCGCRHREAVGRAGRGPERPRAHRAHAVAACRWRAPLRLCRLRLPRAARGARPPAHHSRWSDPRGGGRHRRRQDHRRPTGRPLLGPVVRAGAARWGGPPRSDRSRPPASRHHRHPGELPVLGVGGRQHPARSAGGDKNRDRGGRRGDRRRCLHPRLFPPATTPTSTRRGPASRRGSASWCPSPGRSSPTLRC